MIPKGVGTNFRGLVLVEGLWKVIYGIFNRWILSSVQFHDALHSFCAGIVTVTATLEANMLQQLIAMRYTFLHFILLYLCKACNALYSDRCLDILAGYGVGPRTLRILRTY